VARVADEACKYERYTRATMTAPHAISARIENGRVTARGKALRKAGIPPVSLSAYRSRSGSHASMA